jgi:hypothetical protein
VAPKNKGGRPSNPTPRWNPEKERWEVRLSIPGLSGAKQMGTVPERRSRMKRVLEIIGTTPITSVTRDQITNVRDMLDGETLVRAEAAKAASKKDDASRRRLPRLSWKTAFHTWLDLQGKDRPAVGRLRATENVDDAQAESLEHDDLGPPTPGGRLRVEDLPPVPDLRRRGLPGRPRKRMRCGHAGLATRDRRRLAAMGPRGARQAVGDTGKAGPGFRGRAGACGFRVARRGGTRVPVIHPGGMSVAS